tara:strand:+ start:8304 stop:9185 length:882 start_codon:yes stop_codon:yes gene_type:complete
MEISKTRSGLVTKKFNEFYHVDIFHQNSLEKELCLLCKSRKNVYYQNKSIFVGDEVIINEINFDQRTAIIVNLISRRNFLERPAVANISDIYIINSVDEPKLNYSQLSQFLIKAELLKVKVSLVLTKCDLISNERKNQLIKKFTHWGYHPRTYNLIQDDNFYDFTAELKDKSCSILVGPSGVGKTTLLNKIIPDLNKPTGSVSKKIKRGKNTTRNIELFKLSSKSYIVDTPGFNIQNFEIAPKYIANLFPEFRRQKKFKRLNCKFRNCLHLDEPGCNLNKDFERYQYYRDMIS